MRKMEAHNSRNRKCNTTVLVRVQAYDISFLAIYANQQDIGNLAENVYMHQDLYSAPHWDRETATKHLTAKEVDSERYLLYSEAAQQPCAMRRSKIEY